MQAFVWGVVRPTGDGGALLPGLRGLFGLGYAALLVAAELGVCAWFRMARAAVWVLVGAALVDLVFVSADLAGLHFRSGAAAALTAGFGALVLAAGVLSGRFVPRRDTVDPGVLRARPDQAA